MNGIVPFCDKSAVLITGSSQSGKTQLLRDILVNYQSMFQTTPSICIFLYTHWQDLYNDIKEKWGNKILFTQRVPNEEEIERVMSGHSHGVFVADDKGESIEKVPFFRNLLSRLGHHCRMTSFCLLQDANLSSRASSLLKKNFHVTIVMRSPSERSFVRAIGMQTGDYRCVMEAYDDARNERYGYLCIHLHPAANPEFKYRTNITPSANSHCVIYKPKSNKSEL